MVQDDLIDGLVCPECGSDDVLCVRHPTAHGWFVFQCQAWVPPDGAPCGHEGGDHRHDRP